MQMVHVWKWQKAMQRRVDRRRHGVVAERAERVHLHHGVFSILAAIEVLKRQQLLLVKSGESAALDTAQVAAAALHPQPLHGFSAQWVAFVDLGTGVAACEVGKTQAGAEKTGSITQ